MPPPPPSPSFVDLSAWVFTKSRILSRRQHTFLKLNGALLSASHTPLGPIEWELDLDSAILRHPSRRSLLILSQSSAASQTLSENPQTLYICFSTSQEATNWYLYIEKAIAHRFDQLYVIQKKIGEGAFASVYRGVRKRDGGRVAVKIVKKKRFDLAMNRELEREMYAGKVLKHAHIVQVEDVFNGLEKVHLVMEELEGGSLKELVIKQGGFIGELMARAFVKQILLAVAYLHDNTVVHRDIKLENVMCCGGVGGDVKLADFGYVGFLENHDAVMRSLVGTPVYVAPELVMRGGYGMEVDIWAIGVMVYRMMCGEYPFDAGEDDEETMRRAVRDDLDFSGGVWIDVSEHCKGFIRGCLEKKANVRLTAVQALRHEWILMEGKEEEEMGSPVTDCGDDVFLESGESVSRKLARKRWRVAICAVLFVVRGMRAGREFAIRKRNGFRAFSKRKNTLTNRRGGRENCTPVSGRRASIANRIRRTFSFGT